MKNLGTARRRAATLALALGLVLGLVLGLAACATVPALPDVSDRPRPAAAADTVDGTAEPVRAPAEPPSGSDGELSPYDENDPGISRLDADLRQAVQAAAADANADGVRFWVTSGWRSRSHQQRLLDEAVQRYGSLAEAERFVSTPDKSAHVRGDAVDVGPTDADSWLAQHGARYALCQAFANEAWHFELATSPGGTCPAPIPDSSYR